VTHYLTYQRQHRGTLLAVAAAAAVAAAIVLMLIDGGGLVADIIRRAAGFTDDKSIIANLTGAAGANELTSSDVDGFNKLLAAGSLFIPVGVILSVSALPVMAVMAFGAISFMGHKVGMKMLGMSIGACLGMICIGGISA
jgi:hypothetical protein